MSYWLSQAWLQKAYFLRITIIHIGELVNLNHNWKLKKAGSSLFRVGNSRERMKRQDSRKGAKNAKNGENGRHRKPVSFLASCLEVEPSYDQQQGINAEETRDAGRTLNKGDKH